jgi:hypothetical protein
MRSAHLPTNSQPSRRFNGIHNIPGQVGEGGTLRGYRGFEALPTLH